MSAGVAGYDGATADAGRVGVDVGRLTGMGRVNDNLLWLRDAAEFDRADRVSIKSSSPTDGRIRCGDCRPRGIDSADADGAHSGSIWRPSPEAGRGC